MSFTHRFCGGAHERKDRQDLLRGYRRSLSKAGLSESEHEVRAPVLHDPEESGARAVAELLGSRRDADGIVFIDDYHALGGMRTLAEFGVAVPSDIMVATHVNLGYALSYPAPVVRLEVDPSRIAAGLLELLESWWAGRPPEEEMLGIGVSVNSSELS